MPQRRLATAALVAAFVVVAGCASAPIGGRTATPAPATSDGTPTANEPSSSTAPGPPCAGGRAEPMLRG